MKLHVLLACALLALLPVAAFAAAITDSPAGNAIATGTSTDRVSFTANVNGIYETFIYSTTPGAPTIGTATAGNASASVAFTAPASNGGATITSYTVTSSPGGFTGSGTSSPITVNGLTNGTAYTFTVTATNTNGIGSASDSSNSVTPATTPSVSSPTSANVTHESATLGGDVTATGGSAITDRGIVYSITSTNAAPALNGSGVTNILAIGTTGGFTIPATGLVASTSYSYAAYATNAVGTTYSVIGTFTTAIAPSAVTNATLTATGTYGSAFTTYTITGSNSPTSYSATGLPAGLSIDTGTGAITGTPTASGNFSATIGVSNASGGGTATLELTIAKAALTVTADAKTRPYAFVNPPLTATITGFLLGDTVGSAVSGSPSLSTTANTTSNPGPYAITAALGTLTAANYTFSLVDGTLTVRLQEFADWQEENFTPAELFDVNISGPTADPDFDGVTNFYEYAFNTDPNDLSSGPNDLLYSGSLAAGVTLTEEGKPIRILEVVSGVNQTRVLFLRRKAAFTSDVVYYPEFSSSGTAWVTSLAVPVVLADAGLYELVSVPYPSTTSGKKTRFFRVAAEAPSIP